MAVGDLVTEDWMVEYSGWSAGGDEVLAVVAIEGLESLDAAPGDPFHPLAGEHGSVPALRRQSGKTITITFDAAGGADDLRTAVAAFKRATSPRDTEERLVLRLPEWGTVFLGAVPGPRIIPTDLRFLLGSAQLVATWDASDPVVYGLDLHSTVVPVFVGSGGLEYDVEYPKDYGSAGSGLTTEVPNDGDWPCWPRITITGPTTGTVTPTSIENVTTGEEIAFTSGGGLTIPAGSTLVVDTHPARRVVRMLDGANRWHTVAGTTWWPILPGGADLRFRAAGTTDGVVCTVETRDAWM